MSHAQIKLAALFPPPVALGQREGMGKAALKAATLPEGFGKRGPKGAFKKKKIQPSPQPFS